jgi:hypothetical protein
MSAAEREGAANACTAATRFLPRPGTSRGTGAWHAVLGLTEAFCLRGCRGEAGRLQLEAEKIAAEWDCSMVGFPVLTAAGIAAACAGNWTSAEKHYRASIARMEAVPYVTAQPIARYWYADTLAERGGPGDIEAASGATSGFHHRERCDRARVVCSAGTAEPGAKSHKVNVLRAV